QLLAYLPPGVGVDPVLVAIDEEVSKLSAGPEPAEVDRVVTAMVSDYVRHLDSVLERAMTIGILEQQRHQPELVNELPAALARITPTQVAAAVGRWMGGPGRAVLEVV